MPSRPIFACSTLALFLTLTLASATTWAQEAFSPRSPAVDLDEECVLSPRVIISGETDIAVWQRYAPTSGIFARKGDGEYGPTTQLIAQENVSRLGVVPIPGGFTVVWTRSALGLYLQRFDLEFAPLGPPTQVLSGEVGFAYDFDELGNFVLASWQDGSVLEVRRFSATGQQVGPVASFALSPAGFEPKIQLGDQGYLVVWHRNLDTSAYAQAFSNSGAPLGSVVPLGTGRPEVARSQSGYLVLVGSFSRLLGEDGLPLGDNVDLGVSGDWAAVVPGEDGFWATWITNTQILGAQLDSDGRLVDLPTELVPIPPNQAARSLDLRPLAGGFRVSWVMERISAIMMPPCEVHIGGFTQDFGPSRGVVDVPALTPSGLALSVLLFATAGLMSRRFFH